MTYPVTQAAVGEMVTSAQFNLLPVALAEATGAGASYDFTSIPQVWTHLLFICSLQTGAGATHDDVKVTFNGDVTSRYYEEKLRGTGSTASAVEQIANAAVRVGSVGGQAAGGFSSTVFVVPNYAAVQIHSCVSLSFSAFGIATGNLRSETYGGVWNSAAAINRVTITPSAGSWVAGSSVTIYGMGAI